MKREFWAEYDLYSAPQKRELIHFFVGRLGELPSPLSRWKQIQDQAARQQMLAHLLTAEEECARRTKCKDYAKGRNGLQWWYYGDDVRFAQGGFQNFLRERIAEMQEILRLQSSGNSVASHVPEVTAFPRGSWALQVPFALRKPYISKDDREFYILDNPVRKEWVFQVPYIAPSQWKGALRAAMVQELKWWWESLSNGEKTAHAEEFARRRFRMTLLFGDEKGEEPGSLKGLVKYLDDLGGEEAADLYREKVRRFFKAETEPRLPHHRGWLHFYPTYFDRIGLEVINPHPRDTGAGKQPIYFECVPAGTEDDPTRGTFTLLYVPLGEVTEDEMKADFRAVAEGLKAMFTVYGFGAKTSSGFGRAEVTGMQVKPERWYEVFLRVWNEAKAAGGGEAGEGPDPGTAGGVG